MIFKKSPHVLCHFRLLRKRNVEKMSPYLQKKCSISQIMHFCRELRTFVLPIYPKLIFGGTSGTGGRVNFFVSCVNFLKNNAKCYIISTPKGRFQLDFLRKILAAKTAVAEIF